MAGCSCCSGTFTDTSCLFLLSGGTRSTWPKTVTATGTITPFASSSCCSGSLNFTMSLTWQGTTGNGVTYWQGTSTSVCSGCSTFVSTVITLGCFEAGFPGCSGANGCIGFTMQINSSGSPPCGSFGEVFMTLNSFSPINWTATMNANGSLGAAYCSGAIGGDQLSVTITE